MGTNYNPDKIDLEIDMFFSYCDMPFKENPFNFFLQTLLLTLFLSMLSMAPNAYALDMPTGRVILKVTGNISATNVGDAAHFDRKMLEQLPSASFVTGTPWTSKAHRWEGVLVSELLRHIGAGSQSFVASALDDYKVHVKGIDFTKYPVIFALKQDDKVLVLRNKGPIWLMFPWDDFPEIHNETNLSLSIWQLSEIKID